MHKLTADKGCSCLLQNTALQGGNSFNTLFVRRSLGVMPMVQTITILRTMDMVTVQGALASANVTSTGDMACGVSYCNNSYIHVNVQLNPEHNSCSFGTLTVHFCYLPSWTPVLLTKPPTWSRKFVCFLCRHHFEQNVITASQGMTVPSAAPQVATMWQGVLTVIGC